MGILSNSEMPGEISLPVNLAFAAISGSGATVCVQPMDLVKNRMQTNPGLSVGSCVGQIIKADGITGLWTGLGAGLLRQCSYTTVSWKKDTHQKHLEKNLVWVQLRVLLVHYLEIQQKSHLSECVPMVISHLNKEEVTHQLEMLSQELFAKKVY